MKISSELFSLLETFTAEADEIKALFTSVEASDLDAVFITIGRVLENAQEGEVRVGDLRDLLTAAVGLRSQINRSSIELKEIVGVLATNNVFCHASELSRRLEALTKQELQEACETFK